MWTPREARFSFADVDAAIGQSRGQVSGDLVLGFDQLFGPTVGLSIRASDVWLHPDDLDAPQEPFELFSFEGWTAPLYGAIGIDRMVGARENVSVVMQGRVDTVREGIGLDVTISGRGASSDDLKRLWPYLFSPEVRSCSPNMSSTGRSIPPTCGSNFLSAPSAIPTIPVRFRRLDRYRTGRL